MTTKVDIINGAFSELRISGLTVIPSPEDLDLALAKLEDMAAEFEANNICTGYAFEETPDLNTPHNMQRKFWHGYQVCLAVRLLDNFGKQPTASLVTRSQAAFSFLSARTAPMKRTLYPARQPVGSKNRFGGIENFYGHVSEAPLGCATNEMFIGDVDNFAENFTAWLVIGETISSYTITANDGLTVVSDSNTDTQVIYQIQADGTDGETSDALLQVKIVVTSSAARVATRIINFKLNSAEI